jgi:hypothetical protein
MPCRRSNSYPWIGAYPIDFHDFVVIAGFCLSGRSFGKIEWHGLRDWH